MFLIDRYIFIRFVSNFVLLFLLLSVFAIAIDAILHLDRFVDAAREVLGREAGTLAVIGKMVVLILHFESPRVLQLYAYLHGLVAVGAMGFTLAQLYRHRELVALMATGISLHRVAMPFIVGMFLFSVLQLLNQEFILPRIAPLLLRGHGEIGRTGVDEYEISFTADSDGNLLQAPGFDPHTGSLRSPTFLERDERGRTRRRISADSAVWDAQHNGWSFTNGIAITLQPATQNDSAATSRTEPISLYQTSLSPQVLIVRRYGQFAGMLSLSQIRQMLDTPGIADAPTLQRHQYARFSVVLVNLLVLWITLPCFLLREPSNLLVQTVMCASMAIPGMMGAAIGMMVEMPGIPPAVAVFLPVLVLIPVALARFTYIKT
jgi:lipopolysaccharide export system permease protein